MSLPCRHILKFLIVNEFDPFVPELCAIRWTKEYYANSHPGLSSHVQINNTAPVYVQVRDKNRIDQYKKSNTITKEIRDIAINLPSSEQTLFLDKLKDLRNEMRSSSSNSIRATDDCVDNPLNFCVDEEEANAVQQVEEMPLDLSMNRQLTSATDQDSPELDLVSSKENFPTSSQQNNDEIELSVFKKSQRFSILSSIENVKVPEKVNSVGRQPGRVTTAIGIKRKKSFNSKSIKKINEDQCIKRFAEKTQTEQAFTIIEWLTLKKFS